MKIEIVNKSNNPLPAYETEFSAGMDLRAFLSEDLVLAPMQRTLVPTGIFIAVPEGHEAQVRPRSGLAIKNGISVLNTPGTIDSDYRGEVKIILFNFGTDDFVIKRGERIAQMVLAKVYQMDLTEVKELNDSERGAGGFGHTGTL